LKRKYKKREKHKCKVCDNLTYTTNIYCCRDCYNKDHNIIITCKNCGTEKTLPKNRSNQEYCSIKCANINLDRKETNRKAKKTLKNKYGVSNPFEITGYNNLKIDNIKRGKNISKSYSKKSEEDKLERNNKISKSLQSKNQNEKQIIKLKRENTNLTLFGVKNTLQHNSPLRFKAEINNKNSQISKYEKWLKDNNLILLDEYKGVKDLGGNIIYYNFKHIPTNNIFIDHLANGRLPIFKDPTETIGISNQEKNLIDFIKNNYSGPIITNNRKIVKGFEIDIFLPELNLAFEFNGLYWHSELKGKTRNYHLNKTQECLQQNIQLIQIFEDEWVYKQDIVKSRILNLLNLTPTKIHARKCKIKIIDNKIKNRFLISNHIQGEDKSKIKLGLYHDDELVSVITFSKLRKVTGNKNTEGSYELLRFCNKLNTNVIGGFSKLLNYFIKNYFPKLIISYADRRWSLGKVYEKNNFNFIHNTPPNYWYTKYYKIREHRYKYRKSELPKILDNYNDLISEWENMKNNKYNRIWDCGSKKYQLNISV
jgi:hypothetical protein